MYSGLETMYHWVLRMNLVVYIVRETKTQLQCVRWGGRL
jgi:hypothetical protein